MAVTSKRSVIVNYTGDLTLAQEFRAADSLNSPSFINKSLALATGDTTIGIAIGSKSVTIIPETGNTTALKIKGAAGDTGIRIHDTDPTSIAVHSTTTSIVINAGAFVTIAVVFT